MKRIESLLKNEIARKTLMFFFENPQSIDTAKGISVWIGCNLSSVQKALNKLVKTGILVTHKTPSIDAYAYTNQRDVVKKIEKYIAKQKRAQ